VDLKLRDAPPSPAERAAADRVLGSKGAPSGGRSLLLPALQAVQGRQGWVSEEALHYICRRLQVPPAEGHGVATFYSMISLAPGAPAVARVCDDVVCRLNGAEALCADLEKNLGPAGAGGAGKQLAWMRSPCLGHCERAPAALVARAGAPCLEATLAPASAGQIREVLEGKSQSASPAAPPSAAPTAPSSVPQAGSPNLRLLRRIGRIRPDSLDDYRADGGYRALPRAIELGAEAVIGEIKASGLMGRGGAAFPAGRKWEAVALAEHPKYLVCNADESEPGTFKDRVLMEEDPYALVEAMTIAAWATGCEQGFLYVRGEYPLAAERLARAIESACREGLLGENILGRGFRFDIEIRRGGGAYICGEETALFNSIEGKRGEPRSKPPFPVQAGLFGRPTLVHNVETLANVPGIVLESGKSFASAGTAASTGTRLFCVSGRVARPGVYEIPLGTPLRDLLDLAGGVTGGESRLQAVLLGGAAGTFLTPREIGLPLSFEGARAAGATLGSGAVVVLDDRADLWEITGRIAAFFREESCGQCVPCRLGTVQQEAILETIRGNGHAGEARTKIAEIGQAMRDASICGLGQTASSAVLSALEKFAAPAEGKR
jgi:NADH-quinone oxidoreductase subunit F